MFAAVQAAVPTAEEKTAKAAGEHEARWRGTIVRSDKNASTLTVRKGNIDKTVHYDNSTKLTKRNQDATMDEIKDGEKVTVLGKYDDDGAVQATHIDLGSPGTKAKIPEAERTHPSKQPSKAPTKPPEKKSTDSTDHSR